MRPFATLSLCLSFAAAACSRGTPQQDQQPPAPGFAADPTSAPGTQDLAPLGRLAPQLSAEIAHRPQTKVSAEKLFDSLAEHGVTLAAKHQVLAVTAGAAYCMLGVTPDTVAIAVCEYPTHDAALAGERMLDSKYSKLVPDAKRAVNGNTLVTVANAEHHAAVRDRVFQTFQAL